MASAGERWYVARAGRGTRFDVRTVNAGGIGSVVARGFVDRCDALLAAEAPAMYEALLALVSEAREDGFFADDTKSNPLHPVGCSCSICSAVRALAAVEGGGRCILCGCIEEDACACGPEGEEEGCAWADAGRFVCTAHPARRVRAALSFVARWRRG
jgi:hypothetical protein